MPDKQPILAALRQFADTVTEKMTQLTPGEPEDQLRGPFDNFMAGVADALGCKVVCTGETKLPGRLGKPDYAVHLNQLLAGFVELKAPGVGANPRRFTGHNREQWKRFKALPNLLYCDGNEWALYRGGELVRKVVRLSGDVATDGRKAVAPENAHAIGPLLQEFFLWEPTIPRDKKGKIDLKEFADLLAPLCRMLRNDVTDALKDPQSPLVQLAKDWRQLLFPDAGDEQFADAYAQTVTFGLLLACSEGADPLTLDNAEKALAAEHSLLSRALQVLTDPGAQAEISASLNLLLRVIGVVSRDDLVGTEDPWLYFYEDFLAAYDPKLRKDAGVYYTPPKVVHAQVRLIDHLLIHRLGKPLGFADPGVVTLDPAAGTGTYLLGVIEHAMKKIKAEQGRGAVAGQATALANNLYGFELMVGPYAVTELRVSRALRDRGATLPKDGTHVYLTDTLESPDAEPPVLPLFLRPIAEQHTKALNVKNNVPVIVCLGNPPYDRHDAVDTEDEDNLSRYGGWVRFGDPLAGDTKKDKRGKQRKLKTARARLAERERRSILRDFVEPVVQGGHGVHLKWLYNLYVYFWRWALWKVFEHETAHGPGVVSFISASSYLYGDAFCGMREHMRRLCDEVWILDLGGEGRGGRKDENIFAIQTPVAIAVAVRSKKSKKDEPAKVHYARIDGSRDCKLAVLDSISDFASVKWQDCPNAWHGSFMPLGDGGYFNWPIIEDLFPWHHSGSQLFRTWPIAPDEETLLRRWQSLLNTDDRAKAFKESRDRKINRTYLPLLEGQKKGKPIADLLPSCPPPSTVRYGFRSLDRQYTFCDSRIGDVMKPVLWNTVGEPKQSRQLFLTSQRGQVLGKGPALMASHILPDFNSFCGRAGAAIPLYRTANASEANILPGLLNFLSSTYYGGKKWHGHPGHDSRAGSPCHLITPEDFLAYVYGALAQPAFTARYAKELETRELRVPITKDAALFEKVRDAGARLLWLHTCGERFVPKGKKRGHVPRGAAKCTKAVPGHPDGYPDAFHYNDTKRTLHVGDGAFRPVAPEVFAFEVSGLKVVQSWLKYRMKKGAGKKSSPLDDIRPERWTSQFTTELLELLWVLEATVEGYPEQAKLLDVVVKAPCFRANEFPSVPEEMRKPPAPPRTSGEDFLDGIEDE